MSLSVTDFVAENVEVLAKYTKEDGSDFWSTGVVTNVIAHGIVNGHNFVKCEVEYKDEKTEETFWDYDYETDNENAWRFSMNYRPLVEKILGLSGSDTEGSIEDVDYTPLNSEESEEESEDESVDEVKSNDEKRNVPRNSVIKCVFAMVWTFAPTIATVAVLFNARNDIIRAIKNDICAY